MRPPELAVPSVLRSGPDSCNHPAPVQVWPDSAGAPFCCCYGRFSVHVRRQATFALDPATSAVTVTAHTSLTREGIRQTYERDVLPVLMQATGAEVLHAGAALTPRGVVAFCGKSGSGKSTLACALALRGHPLWADDAVAVDDEFRSVPLPFSLRLREPSASHFATRPAPVGADHAPAPLAAIFLPARADRLDVRRVAPSEAFPVLLEHAYCFSLADEALKRRMVERYLALAARVPAYELKLHQGLENLSQAIDLVEGFQISDVRFQ